MRNRIDCFFPAVMTTLESERAWLANPELCVRSMNPMAGEMTSTASICEIAQQAVADYVLLWVKPVKVTMGEGALRRMVMAADMSGAAMVYGDYWACPTPPQESDEASGSQSAKEKHPVIDWQIGSVRNDFDFGSVVLVRTALLKEFVPSADYQYAGFYDLWLFLSRRGELFHLNELLYTEEKIDLRTSGEKQFDYVNPANREVQVEMERAVTAHLKEIGAWVDTTKREIPDFEEQPFAVEASVVIPVFNRAKTIRDAVESALSQQTTFPYNVIVVDNHSTDGTSEILKECFRGAGSKERGARNVSTLSTHDPQLIVITPERRDLGIGGCWNEAVNDARCGRFAVQLDSDDLYSSPHTLQQMVDAFYEQKAAMVVGSYRMCDFDLNTLPPGLINHAEWTDENGPNNALRINGLGAPRAFFTPLLRDMQLPNTSYGEDYAMGLAFSRNYRIGRIYTELYLCRRWTGNSDAALSVERVNANNLYKDRLRTMEILARQRMKDEGAKMRATDHFVERQLSVWDEARQRYQDLNKVQTRELEADGISLRLQFNPARMVSTGAKIDKQTLDERPCFLCEKNRPEVQMACPTPSSQKGGEEQKGHGFELLLNPFPILPVHFTIPSTQHEPQRIAEHIGTMWQLLERYPHLTVFYNGPMCGASAPDHLHFQAGEGCALPLLQQWPSLKNRLKPVCQTTANEQIMLLNEWPGPALVVRCATERSFTRLFRRIYKALPAATPEPMMNIVGWKTAEETVFVVFLRKKHRPACYPACMVSPGALDMAGLVITPQETDFRKLQAETVVGILKEVSLEEEEVQRVVARLSKPSEGASASAETLFSQEPTVKVGIVSAQRIRFTLNGPYSAKGEVIEGEQEVFFFEGGISWNGSLYRELKMVPLSGDASFSLEDVTIGVNFHWERKETQTFQGMLHLVVEEDKICAINELPVEQYLASVISSEMSATSSLELLKAHAVISRSWLLAQMKKRSERKEAGGDNGFFSFVKKENEIVRWYDREDHTIFDVCADDHCQRYQGITKASNPHVAEAVEATRGQILTYEGKICDARFSKCCGGQTEEFEYCWEDEHKPYLTSVRDAADENSEAFCNTHDEHILRQVLNDYDQETPDFFEWTVEYTQQQLLELIESRLKMTFGQIVSLEPLERGKSGRISRLKIVGTERQFIIGKELEIRRTLSDTHLKSSNFEVSSFDFVTGIPQRFVLHGHGWGHGVGLCQIGAAVMGERGYRYDDILRHYYLGIEISKAY